MSNLAISESITFRRCAANSRSFHRRAPGKGPRQFTDAVPLPAHTSSTREASDHLVLALLPLVRQVAGQMLRHLPSQVEMGDLIQEGVLGLMDALKKFDVTRHVKIESYARHRIRGAILDSLRRSDPASRDARRKAHRAARAAAALEARLGRQPTSIEMAHELGLSLEQWYKLERQVQLTAVPAESSLDQGTGNQSSLATRLPAAEMTSPFDACYRREQQDMMKRALDCLAGRDRMVINLYYQNSLTMKEIGQRLGVDESRVSQLHSRALHRLKACVRALARPASLPSPMQH